MGTILFICAASFTVVAVALMKTRRWWLPPITQRVKARREVKNLDAEYRELLERYKRHE